MYTRAHYTGSKQLTHNIKYLQQFSTLSPYVSNSNQNLFLFSKLFLPTYSIPVTTYLAVILYIYNDDLYLYMYDLCNGVHWRKYPGTNDSVNMCVNKK